VNSSFFIARRYLFSKKSQNVINIISGISIFGITIATAAMVIVISAFNGVEGLVVSLFNAFEPDLKIESAVSKTFPSTIIPQSVFSDSNLTYNTKVIEETVIFKHYDQFAFGTVKGVEPEYLKMVNMPDQILEASVGFDGNSLVKEGAAFGFAGYILFQNLGGYIYDIPNEYESLTVYAPKRNQRITRQNTKAFNTTLLPIAGVFSFNNKVNENYVIIPFELAKEMLDYEFDISAIELQYEPSTDINAKKVELQNLLGKDFEVKTAFEQNELIYKTSRSEKWMVVVLLGFIFFLGTFTMVASITMLILEKKDNIFTMRAMGATNKQLRSIFFGEGLLINGIGISLGVLIGLLVSYSQIHWGWLKMDGGMVENFPVAVKFSDIFLILVITTIIGTVTAYLPSKILIQKAIHS
jgi:lipoprotein-releasing system permease protein